jgi:hypothetical protein
VFDNHQSKWNFIIINPHYREFALKMKISMQIEFNGTSQIGIFTRQSPFGPCAGLRNVALFDRVEFFWEKNKIFEIGIAKPCNWKGTVENSNY